VSTVPTIDDVHRAAGRIAGVAVRTPLVANPILDERTGGRVFLKCEVLQRTGSFKFRGAYNAVAAMNATERGHGVVAVSSGNHAQGVAEAARLYGIPATIVMPADAPRIKRERTERSGARIVPYDRTSEDREKVAAEVIGRDGGTLIHPYNDRNVIAGQGTIGLEIAEDCRATGVTPDMVAVPCSGGGLSAGVGLALRDAYPGIAVMLVEPEGFDDYARSLAAGHAVSNARTSGSVADALLSPSPGSLGFAIHAAAGSSACTVTDDEALAAVAFAFRELKLVVEPGGAVALAALLAGRVDCRGRTVAVVLSGGNIDESVLTRALAAGETSR
jgi:threonine dehydratase